MGTDAPESMGFSVSRATTRTSTSSLTRAETERLFHGLAAGGTVDMPLQDMFWGAYFGSLTDPFGVHWMFNCSAKP
jgi:PhnB protein